MCYKYISNDSDGIACGRFKAIFSFSFRRVVWVTYLGYGYHGPMEGQYPCAGRDLFIGIEILSPGTTFGISFFPSSSLSGFSTTFLNIDFEEDRADVDEDSDNESLDFADAFADGFDDVDSSRDRERELGVGEFPTVFGAARFQ